MTTNPHPHLLTVLFDANCSLCRRCKAWLMPQSKFVGMDFMAYGGEAAAKRFPNLRLKLDKAGKPDELVVIANDGRVWRGDGAWVMVLWALREYRALAVRLARNPVTMALARRAFAFISHNRTVINDFWVGKDDALVSALKTPGAEAFEKRVMVCALPGPTGRPFLSPARRAG